MAKEKVKYSKMVSVIGLGKLGACLLVSLASKGFKVIGYDTNEKTVSLVNAGKAPVEEPQLAELLRAHKKNILATNNFSELLSDSDTTFIIVPTPSKKDGSFSSAFLKDVVTKAGIELRSKKSHHTFVINSTVSPTTTDSELIPLLEKYSGKQCNKDFSVCYNPEFIALGDVINGILKPDVVLIGESNEAAGRALESIYKKLCDNSPDIARMSIVSAEIMKISLNSFVTMKISFANTLGRICQQILGANVDHITKALGADRRISPHYMKAGLPFGGPCFPRDNRAFHKFAKSFGVDAKLARATDQTRNDHLNSIAEQVIALLKKDKHTAISVLGLSYKPKTGVIEESASIELITRILSHNPKVSITVYDPLAMKNAENLFGKKIAYASSVDDCLKKTACWIIASPEKEYINACQKNSSQREVAIIDCWRVLNQKKLGKGVKYVSMGKR